MSPTASPNLEELEAACPPCPWRPLTRAAGASLNVDVQRVRSSSPLPKKNSAFIAKPLRFKLASAIVPSTKLVGGLDSSALEHLRPNIRGRRFLSCLHTHSSTHPPPSLVAPAAPHRRPHHVIIVRGSSAVGPRSANASSPERPGLVASWSHAQTRRQSSPGPVCPHGGTTRRGQRPLAQNCVAGGEVAFLRVLCFEFVQRYIKLFLCTDKKKLKHAQINKATRHSNRHAVTTRPRACRTQTPPRLC